MGWFMATNPYDKYSQEIIGLERQRETARKLREQGEQQLKGEMVSGHYVAPHWSAHLANALKDYTGMQMEQKADKGIQDVQNRRVADRDAWLGQMPTAKQETLPEGVEGPTQTFKPKTEDYLQWATKGMAFDPATAQMGMTYANLNEQRDQRKSELAAKLQDAAASRAEKIEAQKQLMQMQQEGRMDMARLAASLRPAPQAQAPVAIIDPATGKETFVAPSQAYGKQPAKSASPLSAAQQKEVLEADDVIQSSQNVIGTLQQALKINPQAYSGYGAKARAVMRSNLPGQSPEADATIQLENMMSGQALESLKSTFGGNPTEGERKILLDLQASSDKTPQQREAIIQRAIQAANNRLQFNQRKAEALRGGEYMKPGYSPVQPAQQPMPQVSPQGGAKFLGFE